MDIIIDVLRRLELQDEIHRWDIQSPRCHICCHDSLYLSCPELPECHFALVLRDVSMQHMSLPHKFGRRYYLIGLTLGFAEDYVAAARSCVGCNEIRQQQLDVLPRAAHAQMVHSNTGFDS